MDRLSLVERETLILFDESESTANIYTHNRRLMRQLRKIASENTLINIIQDTKDCIEVDLPKSWIKIRAPHILSESERKKRAERARVNLGREKETT